METADYTTAMESAATAWLASMEPEVAAAIGRGMGEVILIASKPMLTVEEVARYTDLSVNYIYKLLQARAFPYSKPNGSKVFVARSDVENWMRSNRIMSRRETEIKAERLYHNRKSGKQNIDK